MEPANHTSDRLNRYSSRTIPGVVDVTGLALGTNTVTVNSLATSRKSEYFRKELTVSNNGTAVWQSVQVQAIGETNLTGNVFVPKTPEIFWYDVPLRCDLWWGKRDGDELIRGGGFEDPGIFCSCVGRLIRASHLHSDSIRDVQR